MTIRILIAEDIDLVAEAFEMLLSVEPEFKVVARVNRGDAILPAVSRFMPEVIVADVDMPGATGIEATAQLRKHGYKGKVLLLTALPGSGHLHAALAAGANGYLLKSTTGARLINAVKAVATGHTAIDPDVAADAIRTGPSPLSERELEILRLVAQGRSTGWISQDLHLSTGTVRNYLSSAMIKLGVDGRNAAVARARERGWM